MRVAFYAPLKPPNHPVPSGDRTMGRALMEALKHAGHEVVLASELRLFDKRGDTEVQTALFEAAETERTRLSQDPAITSCSVWITYHNYYKAPDLIGPKLCDGLGIPYVLIEATRSRKRLAGPWAAFATASEAACDAASAILFFTEQDAEALHRDAVPSQKIIRFPPFLPRANLPARASRATGPILSVGMMRPGDKLASYELVAKTCAQLQFDWHLAIAGDGISRAKVQSMFAPFGDRVTFLGALESTQLEDAYARASCLFWPGVNEAFGMTYLEAQSHGLPIVAQDRPGVRDVVTGCKPLIEQGEEGLSKRLTSLMTNASLRASEGATNRKRIEVEHLLPSAAERLDAALKGVA